MQRLDKVQLQENLLRIATGFVDQAIVSGVVMQVNQCGSPVARIAVGKQHPDLDTPMTEKTVFRLASLTKPVTAAVALIAEEQGLLHLDDAVAAYLPGFQQMHIGTYRDGKIVPDRLPETPAKLSHLLAHCSGFMAEDALGNEQYAAVPKEAFHSIHTMTEYCMNNTCLSFAPCSQSVYSTLAFDLLARIIEEQSGMTYAAYAQKYLFDPLGTTDITFCPTEEQWQRMACIGNSCEGYCYVPHDMGKHTFEGYPLSYTCAGASLCGTAEAYNAFMEMLLHRGIYNGTRILTAESVRKMKKTVCGTWGLAVTVRDGTSALPKDSYGWSGAYGTHFWVDEENQITALMLKNHRNVDVNFWTGSLQAFEEGVMNALVR